VGGIACALYLLQSPFANQTLAAWQSGFWYKVATGTLLSTFVGAQWLLALCRWQSWNRIAKTLYTWHQRLGVLGPVLLFVHSRTLGYAYLMMLSGVFLANTMLGVASPQAFPSLRKHQTPWMAAHIALSVLLICLIFYHVWTALYFE